MPEIGNPGALAGATGAGNTFQASAAGTPSLARRGALGNHGGALALRLARLRRLGLAPGPAALVAALAWGAADG
jgi:hypothetical protein